MSDNKSHLNSDGVGINTYPNFLEVIILISGFRKGVIIIRSIHIDDVPVAAHRQKDKNNNILSHIQEP